VYNVVRPDDIAPCLSLDLIGIPLVPGLKGMKLPSTPFHFGEHFMLRRRGDSASVKRTMFRRSSSLGNAILRITPSRIAKSHMAGSYAKDLLCVASPEEFKKLRSGS